MDHVGRKLKCEPDDLNESAPIVKLADCSVINSSSISSRSGKKRRRLRLQQQQQQTLAASMASLHRLQRSTQVSRLLTRLTHNHSHQLQTQTFLTGLQSTQISQVSSRLTEQTQLVLQQHNGAGSSPQPGIYPRHFGLVFDQLGSWEALRDRITGLGEPFRVEPKCRFSGEALEHWTFFLQDPSANWLEFKHYSNPDAVLGCRDHGDVGDHELR